MFERWKNRRLRKREISQKVREDKLEHRRKQEEFSRMHESERQSAEKQEKQDRKEAKLKHKKAIQTYSKVERKAAKKEARMYKKIWNRPRRLAGWSIVALLLLIVIAQVGPTVKNIADALSGKYITAETDSPEAVEAREYGDQLSEEIANEGMVLLKNENDHLPLGDKKVNVFGVSALDMRYGGGGSGGADTSRAVDLFTGLENAGIEYNSELHGFYQEVGEEAGISSGSDTGMIQVVQGMLGSNETDEPEINYLTDDVLDQAKSYSDNALIVITSEGTEASDMNPEHLRLTENKQALIEKVTDNFDHVTVVINAGNAYELGFLEEYDEIESAIWIGTPGPYGANALGNILAGETNPSGRLTDTYVYDNMSAPASENFGDYSYDNLDYSFINYQEGIYVGYRFYETYFADDEEAYQDTVLYPYGYGLSYTDFEWDVVGQNFTDDIIEVEVEVTNTGNIAGKEVVQLYYSAPYIEDSVEKSAIEMGAFQKTDLLEPNESELVTLTFETDQMASYDMHDEEAYILDPGTYEIKVAHNVHDIVESFDYTIDEKIVLQEDKDTNTPYQNRFGLAEGELNYLSRTDWEGTYPSDENITHEAPDYVVDAFSEETEDSNLEMPTFEADNGIVLEDLKGLDFDDPLWEDYLDQFTLEEMMDFVSYGAYRTMEIERLGVPQSLLMDGPAGFSYFFKPIEAAAYPSEVVLASTWNRDLAYGMGEAVGQEARAYGIQGWYAPGMNIHRTALGGRNFEYFSEDPILSGEIATALTRGAQDQGIIVFMKHFALNDQETNARSGNLVWANEQAIREIYLKPFEMTVKEGEVLGAMSSFSIIGMKWAGANPVLLNDVLRDEWGFEGFVSSDAVFGFMEAPDAVIAGNDLMLDVMTPHKQVDMLEKAYEQDPSGIANGVRTSTHHVLYTILQTHLFEDE
ncbi:glycoside hydrolase family 3 protein [Oceanobacillus jeddahense]|uniref:glycoside hydrolase family 3 protein n=1 Tax=Oceanobacillus jeddahense TaxID=1462527 RepID=UPI0006950360|nr:glycoside hydrolase family 3 protein [Oceanobacillus jeddahense]